MVKAVVTLRACKIHCETTENGGASFLSSQSVYHSTLCIGSIHSLSPDSQAGYAIVIEGRLYVYVIDIMASFLGFSLCVKIIYSHKCLSITSTHQITKHTPPPQSSPKLSVHNNHPSLSHSCCRPHCKSSVEEIVLFLLLHWMTGPSLPIKVHIIIVYNSLH